jgi:RNA-binding protein
MPLTPKQRSELRSLAHHLKPVHHIGREGITDASTKAILEAFSHRELIKVKVLETAPLSARDAGPALLENLPDVEHVQTIGRTLVLYRCHPEKPELLG